MQRTIGAHLECDLITAVDLVLSLAAASGPRIVEESLVVTLDGASVAMAEITEDHGTRLHVADGVTAGRLVVDYEAALDSLGPPGGEPAGGSRPIPEAQPLLRI
jgi:hypothetical protein